ncbi:MAG: lytic transglycosylase domain-containing protein [Sphingomonadales bacterium]|nr:lytic transglycosylase domain-containing protein [Sphingomonadales bacterium]
MRAAIARAAQATGVDFNYLLAQAKLESSLDPGAKAPTSSAAGLYQFTRGTWLQTLERHGANHGMDWAGTAIDGGKVADPGARSQIMAMRYDADTSALMAAELANDNKADLTGVLGREPDAAELYLAHFLGSGGAKDFLTALNANPGQSAAAVVPKAAAANRTIFFDSAGAPRSVAGVMELLRGKVSAAMESGGLPPMDYDVPQYAAAAPQPPQFTGGPIAQQFAAVRQEMAGALPPRASMADTLRTAFAGTGASTGNDAQANVPDFVRAAYGQFQKFGL